MQEQVKIFTFVSGHGETILEPRHEDQINRWLSSLKGQVVHISQSESERAGAGHHITLCIWYIPQESEELTLPENAFAGSLAAPGTDE